MAYCAAFSDELLEYPFAVLGWRHVLFVVDPKNARSVALFNAWLRNWDPTPLPN